MTEKLYERDLQLWIEQTIQHLQNREFEALDVENLIEELTDLGQSGKSRLKSNLTILIARLLKLSVQADAPSTMKSSWYDSVVEHRQRVLDSLEDTPSLNSYLAEAVKKAYPNARKVAIKEGKLARFGVRPPTEDEYPIDCPFGIYQILNEDFYAD